MTVKGLTYSASVMCANLMRLEDDLKALEAMWLEKLKPFGERGYH